MWAAMMQGSSYWGQESQEGGMIWFQFSVVSGGWQYKGGYRVSLVSELRYNGGGLFMLGKGEPTS